MSFFSTHPVLLTVSAFVLGQLSMLLVLGLCTTASAERGEETFPSGSAPTRRRRSIRVQGMAS